MQIIFILYLVTDKIAFSRSRSPHRLGDVPELSLQSRGFSVSASGTPSVSNSSP
uniref:Uncharacterized protein n=1 Tax=Meloidogyne enterolobii TaxID=390850 RepID=A0A6V7UMQ7_MELEN|nr:unnamed protein product [Meloidogyne enterolobii]